MRQQDLNIRFDVINVVANRDGKLRFKHRRFANLFEFIYPIVQWQAGEGIISIRRAGRIISMGKIVKVHVVNHKRETDSVFLRCFEGLQEILAENGAVSKRYVCKLRAKMFHIGDEIEVAYSQAFGSKYNGLAAYLRKEEISRETISLGKKKKNNQRKRLNFSRIFSFFRRIK